MAATTYSLADVQKHNKADDIWLVLHNKVYDVSKYLEDHPGGVAILRDVAGRDATTEFEDVGHSEEANEDLEKLYIGDLAEEEHAEAVEVYRPTFIQVSQEAAISVPKSKGKKNKKSAARYILPTMVGLTAAGAGAAFALNRSGVCPAHIKGLDWVLKTLRRLSLPPTTSTNTQTTHGHTGLFWWGVGIATVANVSLSVVLSLWAWSKFDVQEEFTHYAPRRSASPARTLPYVKNPPVVVKSSTPPPPKVLEPQQWRSFKLVRKVLVSPNVYKLVFALPHASDVLGLPTGQHIALRATINGKPVSRSYTPISNNSDLGRIELLIKVYEKGLMTKHLEAMAVGESIEIRGPKGAMQYVSNSYAKHIGMVAGGTGITPMFQLIRAICDDEDDKTTISLLYANNTEEDILLRDELDGYVQMCPDKFKVKYVLSKPPAEGWAGGVGFVTQDMMREFLPKAEEGTKVLLCGPPPMINAMSKNLVGLGFDAPGPVSRAGDQVFLF
ncbi:hypothetical protein B0H66DRAFT_636313 [Apodospora peruviana]|uniref:NADH-cytochrome b5 reductase 1 n=1 Tax=Apodospora peruviana TaxID=516989 RepID=A0AAE0IVS5_9PEZI|nr:hypothetical protein B0H66DRAFT_636313 [Apodospora peruviana]